MPMKKLPHSVELTPTYPTGHTRSAASLTRDNRWPESVTDVTFFQYMVSSYRQPSKFDRFWVERS